MDYVAAEASEHIASGVARNPMINDLHVGKLVGRLKRRPVGEDGVADEDDAGGGARLPAWEEEPHRKEQRCKSAAQNKAEMPHASDSPSVAYQSIRAGKN